MESFLTWLREWQELGGAALGAFLGGIMALAVSLAVNRHGRRKEENSAALLLVGDLASFQAQINFSLDDETDDRGMLTDAAFARGIHALRSIFLRYRPLSPLYLDWVAKVASVDRGLSELLLLLHAKVQRAENRFSRLDGTSAVHDELASAPHGGQEALLLLALKDLLQAKRISFECLLLLHRLFGGTRATWHRVKRRIRLRLGRKFPRLGGDDLRRRNRLDKELETWHERYWFGTSPAEGAEIS